MQMLSRDIHRFGDLDELQEVLLTPYSHQAIQNQVPMYPHQVIQRGRGVPQELVRELPLP